MAKIVKNTDLTKTEGDPTARACVDLPQEDFEVQAWMKRWPAAGIKIKTRTSSRSALGAAIATLTLTLGGCACTGALAMIGAPTWVASIALLLPALTFFALRRSRQ